jgi:quinol-cytochrome oxidoreductase complex cytochrome b subunit
MADTIIGTLSAIVILAGIGLGLWALRRQRHQYPKGTRIPMDEKRKSQPRWTGMWHRGGQGGL